MKNLTFEIFENFRFSLGYIFGKIYPYKFKDLLLFMFLLTILHMDIGIKNPWLSQRLLIPEFE